MENNTVEYLVKFISWSSKIQNQREWNNFDSRIVIFGFDLITESGNV